MKITCQSCQSKYNVADEKVQGKIVKIRCRKCGCDDRGPGQRRGDDERLRRGGRRERGRGATPTDAVARQRRRRRAAHDVASASSSRRTTPGPSRRTRSSGPTGWTTGSRCRTSRPSCPRSRRQVRPRAAPSRPCSREPAYTPPAAAPSSAPMAAAAPVAVARGGRAAARRGGEARRARARPVRRRRRGRRRSADERARRPADDVRSGAAGRREQDDGPAQRELRPLLARRPHEGRGRPARRGPAPKPAGKNSDDSGLIDLKALAAKAESMRPAAHGDANAFASPLGLGWPRRSVGSRRPRQPLGEAPPKSKLPLYIGARRGHRPAARARHRHRRESRRRRRRARGERAWRRRRPPSPRPPSRRPPRRRRPRAEASAEARLRPRRSP